MQLIPSSYFALFALLGCILFVYYFFRGFCVIAFDFCGWVLKKTGAPPCN